MVVRLKVMGDSLVCGGRCIVNRIDSSAFSAGRHAGHGIGAVESGDGVLYTLIVCNNLRLFTH
jgi:hypothetical protein